MPFHDKSGEIVEDNSLGLWIKVAYINGWVETMKEIWKIGLGGIWLGYWDKNIT